MSEPTFSIVIPTYNRAELLKRCLDSVVAQTFTDWEAIVVDNYSEDNTEEVVLSYNDDRIRYLKNHNHGIIAVSRNKALDLAKGDYICFLDSDDAWLPQKLEIMKRYVGKYDLIYHGFRMDLPKKYPFQRMNNYFYEIKESSVSYVIQRGDPICPSCSCLSAKLLGDTRFDESEKFKAVEDYDFFLQIIFKPPRIKYLRKALTIYDMNGCSHNADVIERDDAILEKWSSLLSEQEICEFKLITDNRRAWYFRSVGDYDQAKAFFKNVMNSKILSKRTMAYVEYLKSIILQIIR